VAELPRSVRLDVITDIKDNPPSQLPWVAHQLAGVGSRFPITARCSANGAMIPTLLSRIKAEEALLSSQFGGEYNAYHARSSRLIPGLY